jgi:tetratricopeptide (TPR) repeat protein
VLLSPASRRTTTAYSCSHRAVFFALIVHVLCVTGATGQTAAASPSESGSSRQQMSYGSSSVTVGRAAKQTETAPPTELAEARSLLQKGPVIQAEKATRQFLQSHPDSAEGHYLLGHILFDEIREKYAGEEQKQGENFHYVDTVDAALAATRDAKARESLAEFSVGARYRAPGASDLKIVGLNYLLLKDLPSAEKWLTASVALNSQDTQAWFYLGRTRYSQTKYAGAIEAFQHCLKLDPRNATAEYNVGLSYEGRNQNDEAIQAYQNAIAWQEHNETQSPDPFVGLARLYLHQNEPEKAVRYLEQAVGSFPQLSLAHEELGKVYSALRRLPEAQVQLEKAVQLSPQKASLRCQLGQVYQQQKMTAKAKTEFEHCTDLRTAESRPPGENQKH